MNLAKVFPILMFVFAFLMLLASVVGFCATAQAQWETFELTDDWGRPAGEYYAKSSFTQSDSKQGPEARLMVPDCKEFEIINGVLTLTKEVTLHNETLLAGTGYVSKIDVMADQVVYEWGAVRTPSSPSDVVHTIVFTENNILRTLKKAKEIKLLLNTKRYGKLIYNFDMTGSNNAIRQACPE